MTFKYIIQHMTRPTCYKPSVDLAFKIHVPGLFVKHEMTFINNKDTSWLELLNHNCQKGMLSHAHLQKTQSTGLQTQPKPLLLFHIVFILPPSA